MNAKLILEVSGAVIAGYLVLGLVLALLARVHRDEPLSVWVSCILTLPIAYAVLQVQAWRELSREGSRPIMLGLTGNGPQTKEGE